MVLSKSPEGKAYSFPRSQMPDWHQQVQNCELLHPLCDMHLSEGCFTDHMCDMKVMWSEKRAVCTILWPECQLDIPTNDDYLADFQMLQLR